jgi:TetR/AcrR family fatty acid metabolism transcriptional regulator
MTETIEAPSRSGNKRARILRAATDVFAQVGYFNARVSQVAKAAGVADGTIYLYFENKEDLLITIFREHAQSYLVSLERELDGVTDWDERIRRAIRHHLATLGSDRPLAIVSQVELRHTLKFMSLFSHAEVAEYLNILRQIIERGQAEGAFRAALHPQLVAKSIFGILDELVTSWILSEKEYDLASQAPHVADFVLRGLTA